jgi:hypothetical protein
VFSAFPTETIRRRSWLPSCARVERSGAACAVRESAILEPSHDHPARGPQTDASAFSKQLKSRSLLERVREDFMSGVRSGVNGTPTFFINGHRFDGSWDVSGLTAALEAALIG